MNTLKHIYVTVIWRWYANLIGILLKPLLGPMIKELFDAQNSLYSMLKAQDERIKKLETKSE